MDYQSSNNAIKRWIPFEASNGEVRRYLVTHDGFYKLALGLFDARFGGYRSSDRMHADLMKTLKARALDAGDYVSIDDEIACLFAGRSLAEGVPDVSDVITNLACGLGEAQLLILDVFCRKGGLLCESVLEELSLDKADAVELLNTLSHEGLIVMKADGKYVLTQEGLLVWAELKFDGGSVGDIDDMLAITRRWENSLYHIHGFEKNLFFLSNFYVSSVELDGLRYSSAEAAYQAGRCKDESEKEAFTRLHPAEAKKYGHHGIVTREDFDDFKVGHMKRVVSAKFSQNDNLVDALLDTYGTLEESNDWDDAFWGRALQGDGRFHGQNMLGEILMEEREQWRERRRERERVCQTHHFKLAEEPYEAIEAGRKDIELRLYDDKRKLVRPGDCIVFSKLEGGEESLHARVEFIDVYPNFEGIFREVDNPVRCGFQSGEEANPACMERYYTAEQLEQYCAVAIGIHLIGDAQGSPINLAQEK